MKSVGEPVKEWHNVTRAQFENEIRPLNRPAVLRSLLTDWPIVQAGKTGTSEAAAYIKSLDNGSPVYTIAGSPQINGAFSYASDFSGVNFDRHQTHLSATIDFLLGQAETSAPPAVSIQSASVPDVLPSFSAAHTMPLIDETVTPKMWLGNRAMVAPHFDVNHNLAAVVAGRRKFTLFPPEQVKNLYVGPMLGSPGGVPTSLVDLRNPDLKRFPDFADAQAESFSAVLEPGDVIYIPTPWWHGVESLESFNVLINYWWGGLTENNISPNTSMMHSMLSISELDESERESWKHLFDYFVFHTTGNAKTHLPEGLHDVITSLSAAQRQQVFAYLKSRL